VTSHTNRFDSQRNRRAELEAPEPATEQFCEPEYWDASESAEWPLTTGQFLLASIIVCMGALAFVL